MKKVLFVLHDDFTKSGATASMLTIIKNIHANGNIDVDVLVPDRGGDVYAELSKIGISVSKFHYYGSRIYLRKNVIENFLTFIKFFIKNFMNVIFALIFTLKYKKKYDVIYTNTSESYFGAMLSLIMKTKHIWHIREFGFEDQNSIHIFGDKFFYNIVERVSEKIIVISNALCDKLKRYLKESEKITVIYNDIDASNIVYNENVELHREKLELLIAGTVVENKGQEKVIDKIVQLKEKGVKVNLTIAGRGEDEYICKLKNKIESLKLCNDVFLVGHVHNLEEFRSKMDLSIVPSVSEAFGRVTIEAMLSGLVVLAYNRGANPELIQHGINGFLYNDYDELNFLLENIYFKREILIDIKENAYAFSKKFTVNSCSMEIESLLLSI